MTKLRIIAGTAVLLTGTLMLPALRLEAQAAASGTTASQTFRLISPKQLNEILKTPGTPKPIIFQVGFRVLYDHGHIPGAEYAGPASSEDGLASLRKRVASLPRDRFIVLYCGCCPWTHCPNIRPAAAELRKMGFTNVKLLHLTTSFEFDWVKKGYPSVQG